MFKIAKEEYRVREGGKQSEQITVHNAAREQAPLEPVRYFNWLTSVLLSEARALPRRMRRFFV